MEDVKGFEFDPNILSIVLFYRTEGCPCVKQKKRLKDASKFFKNGEYNVKCYTVLVDEYDNLDLVVEHDVDTTPHFVYLYGGHPYHSEVGLISTTNIINKAFEIMEDLKDMKGVVL